MDKCIKNIKIKVHKMFTVNISILILLYAGTGFAAHPLISDDAATLGKGNMQLELNGTVGTDKNTANGSITKTVSKQIATAFGVGITDKIDVSGGIARPWGSGDIDGTSFDDPGSADFSLTIKWQAYEHEGLSVAIKPLFGYSYKVGASDDHTVSYGTALILSKELEPFSVHLNTDYIYFRDNLAEVRENNRNGIWSICLGTTFEMVKNLKLVTDFGIATNRDKTSSNMPVFGLIGAIYTFNKSVDLSVGFKAGLTKPEEDLAGTFGLTFKL
jgi:hypothetical protein